MKKILIFTPFCYWNIHTAYELVIAKALQLRNAGVLHITCGKDIPYCDLHDETFSAEHICKMCINNQSHYFKTLNLKHHNLNKIYPKNIKEKAKDIVNNTQDSELINFQYDERPLGMWIHSSINTFFRINHIDLKDKQIKQKYQEYLTSAIIIYDTFKALLNARKPDVLFMFNGRFFTFRIPLELARERGIRTIVHDRGMRNSTIMFKENEVIQGMKTLRNLWNNRKSIPLTKEQIKQTSDYIQDREKGKNTGWYSWAKDKSKLSHLKEELKIKNDKLVYTYFTSSDDEMAAFKEWEGIYDSQIDFIKHLSVYFSTHQDKQLLIRIHPNSGKVEGNKRANMQFIQEVDRLKSDFTENIQVIQPEEEINSYQLIELSDAIVAYFSTISIESVVRRKPVLIAGGGPYANLEFINTLSDNNNLEKTLNELPILKVNFENFKMAYRFVYNYFILSGFDFPLVKQKDPITPILTFNNINQLMPGNDNDLDHICNSIINDKPIYEFSNTNDVNFNEEESEMKKIFNSFSNGNDIDNSSKEITVIIPTYNRADILKLALDALNRQTLDKNKFEVIVVDDGSQDNTKQMIQNYRSDFDLIYLRQENKGPGAARNLAIKNSKSPLILIINDDTICAKDNLEQHLNAHESIGDRKLSVIGTFNFIKDAQRKPFIYFAERSAMIFAYTLMEAYKKYNYRFFWTCNISIKKSALLEVGLFDEDFNEPMMEDTEIGYRLEKLGYSVLYYPDAKSEHYDYNLNSERFAKRQKMSARNIVRFLQKHPEALKTEAKVFGFDNLNESTIETFKSKIKEVESSYHKTLNLMKEIDKIEITNPDFIQLNDSSYINSDELMKIMLEASTVIHLYNYLQGIVETTESKKLIQVSSKIINKTKSKTDKPRVLFTMYGWNDLGGGTMFPKEVAKSIASQGYEIAVLFAAGNHSQNKTSYYLEETEESGIKLFGLYNRYSEFWMADRPDLEIEDKNVINKLEYILDEFQPDFVHYFNFLGLSLKIADAIKDRNIKSIFSPENYHLIDPLLYLLDKNGYNWIGADFNQHSILPEKLPQFKNLYNQRTEKALDILNNKIDYTINISQRVKEIFIDFGAYPDRMKVIHQMPYISKFTENKEPKQRVNKPIRFGFLGSIMQHKGLHIILEAMNKLDLNTFELYIYGFAEIEYLKSLKQNYPHQNIKWVGKYDQSQLEEIADNVDVMIIPSVWEECAGLVVLESIALKTPVIISRIGGMPDFVIEGVNGYTYPYYSPNNLASKMKYLIDNPDKIIEMSKNCNMPVNFNDYVNHILSVYNNLLNDETKTSDKIDFIYKNFL